jgi:regulator of protease activity HflC (stomatin/prohibitin superfamily)
MIIAWIKENLLPFQIVDDSQLAIRLRFGKYVKTLKPGCHWFFPLFSDISWIDVKTQDVDLANISITDEEGNTFSVSGCIVYSVKDPKKALLDVQDYEDTLCNRVNCLIADAIYECKDKPEIEEEVMKNIVKVASKWGLKVTGFSLNEYVKTTQVYRHMGINIGS